MVEYLMRVALLHDDAFIHEQHAVADLAREAHLMGNDDARHVVFRQRFDDFKHLADHFRVEGAGWFVKEHDFRLHRQRAHDGEALLLAAGEAGGLVVALIGKTDAGEQSFRPGDSLVLAHLAQQDGRKGDVVDHGHMREDVEMLENHAHFLAVLGYGMKLIVAQRAEILVNQVYSMYQDANSFTMLMAAFFYAVQIYCDFASYSMIAVGVGRLFGFELVQNFKQPYFAKNLTDFWRRWHISLSSWLRDYIYIPLGGGRKGLAVRQRNILLVFLISGLWHGGAPQFLAWGLLHGAGQVVQDFYKKAKQAVFGEAKIGLEKLRHMLSVLLTFFTVMCFWIFFRSESVSMAVICLKNMFTRWNGFLYWRQFLFTMGLEKTQFFIAIAGIAVLFGIDLISEKKKQEPAVWIYRMPLPVRWAICLFLIGAVFVVGQYGKGFDPSGFIYVEF